ncbi:hypothetical protein [Paenibacillus soyae]|uniref:Uncharacterized protein n=1 Tax=Paenibacillus soyae TaxID=2969249 RepID=A0A9X2MJA3_9BACL|nr:hypothetical protein [Paenibacillus soyae]MCR2802858.1 hypothetical protein [Paenibacillus soyae]
MIKYGSDCITELKFEGYRPAMELREDGQWVDIVLHPSLHESTPAPDDLIQFSILVICTTDGTIAQIVPQDEDCDCEYQFTFSEKEQIASYINSGEVQAAIGKLTSRS